MCEHVCVSVCDKGEIWEQTFWMIPVLPSRSVGITFLMVINRFPHLGNASEVTGGK